MTLSSYNPHTRYKDRAAQRLSNFLGIIMVILVSVALGFWLGKQFGAANAIRLKDEVKTLTTERDELQTQVTKLSATAQTANRRYQQLQEEVESILPAGPMQDLVTLVREQLKQGMDAERLSFVIRSARPPTGCTEPQSKRFVINTPTYNGPSSFASIADGKIKITGNGQSARNKNNLAEAWYDPSKAVNITIVNGDKRETKEGILPLRYSTILENREYRFTIESGARSFAKVVFDSCAYP